MYTEMIGTEITVGRMETMFSAQIRNVDRIQSAFYIQIMFVKFFSCLVR
jgi:hypothetical protein